MITGKTLKDALISGANNILKNREHINELNIFPVPDGDTGTNMSMTISAGIESIKNLGEDCKTGDVIKKFVPSLLRGARGNSGVILSILFRGFSKLFSESESITGSDLVNALEIGVREAYQSVSKPTEGTMLTVARVAFEHGKQSAGNSNDVNMICPQICKGAREALDTTPELLPVLKKAGVVDAGGKGLCLIFEGMLSVFKDNIIIENTVINSENMNEDDVFKNAAAEFDDDITYTYCTEFIAKRNRTCKQSPEKLKSKLLKIGDCVVVVSDDEIIKVHVHTENPGKALQEGLVFGELLTVKIENMKEQHRQAVEQKKEKLMKQESEIFEFQSPEENYGFVAVGAGDGIAEMFKDLGCTHVINGGQTMNPSTEKIAQAILATPAKNVFVLPNNKNIIMAAQQAVGLINDRNVIIVPTKTIPQGISSILAYNPELDNNQNLENMTKIISRVKTGQVTFAARDSEFGGIKIKENDILSLADGKLLFSAKDPVKAVVKLVKAMLEKDSEFVTIIYGEDISLKQAELARDMILSLKHPAEVTLINGGQPIYHFVISIE